MGDETVTSMNNVVDILVLYSVKENQFEGSRMFDTPNIMTIRCITYHKPYYK